MSKFQHSSPCGEKTGMQVAGKWVWEKADWVDCDC